MRNLILCGAPGSGKGTQSDLIVEKYGLLHLSTGDLLRAEISKQSELGQKIDSIISKGNLLPDDMMITLLEQHIASLPEHTKGIIFDGFPRTENQAIELESLMKRSGDETAVLIDLHVDEKETIQRLINRGKTSGRSDDNEDTIRKRLVVYHKQTEPVADFYRKLNKYQRVDGMGTVDSIFQRIDEILKDIYY
ncbi:MAG: adenylate kinase [Paludibacteraceae bacterium]|nr:adenylate kinase [Paludibacteraceae bacterium]